MIKERNNRTKIIKHKISKLAIVSVSFGVLGILVCFFECIICHPRRREISGFDISGVFEIIGLILGVFALISIKKSKGMLKGAALAISAIFLMGLFTVFWWIEISTPRSTAFSIPCQSNLMRIGKAMLIYAYDYDDEYPIPEKWCDLLLEQRKRERGEVDVKDFVCPKVFVYRPLEFYIPTPKKGRCYYAINPNCNPDSPPNTVLVFESKVGWNQYGGPELLNTENHNGDGCFILFNDADVEFVETDQLGKLKWKNNEIIVEDE
jgi:hypothetical protein